jgi:hypothetical protein
MRRDTSCHSRITRRLPSGTFGQLSRVTLVAEAVRALLGKGANPFAVFFGVCAALLAQWHYVN